jgi:hypothetical protein
MRDVWLAGAIAVGLWSCGDDSAPAADGGTVRTDSGMGGMDGGMRTDAGPTPETDSGTVADGGGEVTLTNEPVTCAMPGYTFADAANAGHYAAARLTPPRFPFTVTSVQYTVMHNPDKCNADQVHEVLVFTSTAATPPGMPSGETISVPAPATPTEVGTGRFVELTLSSPIVVSAGEELFVAVQMVRSSGPLCIEECLDPGDEQRNWWSAAATPPFPWRTLASYGNEGTLTMGAVGH